MKGDCPMRCLTKEKAAWSFATMLLGVLLFCMSGLAFATEPEGSNPPEGGSGDAVQTPAPAPAPAPVDPMAGGKWKTKSGKTYYILKDGKKATGFQKISGAYYYFSKKGVMAKGWKTWSNGTKSYFNKKTGKAAKGWKTISKKRYYFNVAKKCRTVKGKQVIKGQLYYFEKDFTLYKGWKRWSGDKYSYFDKASDGRALVGKQVVSDITYTFDENGIWKDSSARAALTKKAQKYSSATNWLCLVDCDHHRVGIFYGKKGAWEMKHFYLCGDGKASTPTVKGTFTVGIRDYYFDHGNERLFYYTQFSGDYLFHTVTYYQDSKPKRVMDNSVGVGVSLGCVRLDVSAAKWIYKHIPTDTKVIVW